MRQIKVGIVGYGNLGRAVERLVRDDDRFNLVSIFSERENLISDSKIKIISILEIDKYKGKIDVLFICKGSSGDGEKFPIKLSKDFNTIDCFDTHKKIPLFINKMQISCEKNKKVALCAWGWDPGIMSLIRFLFHSISRESFFPETFWGKGISQGHSEAIRKIEGVVDAVQYTIPNSEEIKRCRNNYSHSLKKENKHIRDCFVCINEKEDKKRVEQDIKNIPNYFLNQKTNVYFVSKKEIDRRKKKLGHKGCIIKNFKLVNKYKTRLYFELSTESNPYFTAQIMIMGAKIVMELQKRKKWGAYSVLDIPVKSFLSEKNKYIKEML